MCVLSIKVPIGKKSGNLSYAPCIQNTCCGVLSLCRDAVSVFHNPSQLGSCDEGFVEGTAAVLIAIVIWNYYYRHLLLACPVNRAKNVLSVSSAEKLDCQQQCKYFYFSIEAVRIYTLKSLPIYVWFQMLKSTTPQNWLKYSYWFYKGRIFIK